MTIPVTGVTGLTDFHVGRELLHRDNQVRNTTFVSSTRGSRLVCARINRAEG